MTKKEAHMTRDQLLLMEPGDLAKMLRIPILKAYLELEVKDGKGKVITRRRQESRSWVRNAYNIILCDIAFVPHDSANNLKLVDKNGVDQSHTSRTPNTSTSSVMPTGNYGYSCGAVDVYGCVVGTGVGAESFEDYALGTQIANGTGAGQLSYVAQQSPAISTVDTTKKVEHVRYFNNNSGAAITVNEVGMYAYMAQPSGKIIMTCRDLVAGGIEVPDTGQLKVTYTMELTYPS